MLNDEKQCKKYWTNTIQVFNAIYLIDPNLPAAVMTATLEEI